MERSCSLASIKETNNSRTNSKDNSINNVNKYHKDSTGSLHRYASNMDKHALFKKHGHNDTDHNSPIREDNSRQRHGGCNGTPNDRERKRDLHRQYIPVKPHVEANKGTYLNKDIKSQRNSSIKMYSSRRSTTNSEKMSRRNKELESARRQSDNSDVIVRDDNPKHRDWSAEVAQCEESRRVNLKNIESINSIIKQYKAQLDTFDETHEFEITELKELVNKKSLLQKEYTDRISKANAEIAFSKEYILYCDSEKNNIKDGQVLSKVNQCLAFIPSCNSRGANVSDCLSVTCSEIGRSMGLIEHSMEVGQTSKKEEKENFISNSQHNLSKLSLEFPAEDEIEKRKTCKDINQSCCAVDMSNVEPSMTSFGSPRRDEGLLNTTGDDSSQCICDNSEDVKHLSSMVTHIVLDATPKGNPIPASQRGIRELVKAIRKLNTLPPRADVNRYNII